MIGMSRAFVNEDNSVEDVPERPVSPHPNYVTPQGLAAIEAAVADARQAYNAAQASGERDALARAGRDLRYWSARRASAQLVTVEAGASKVQFGSTVTIERDDGRRQVFRIVGEDEAEPSKGTVSHVSPLAVSLIGKQVGDVVRAGRDDAEIVAIE